MCLKCGFLCAGQNGVSRQMERMEPEVSRLTLLVVSALSHQFNFGLITSHFQVNNCRLQNDCSMLTGTTHGSRRKTFWTRGCWKPSTRGESNRMEQEQLVCHVHRHFEFRFVRVICKMESRRNPKHFKQSRISACRCAQKNLEANNFVVWMCGTCVLERKFMKINKSSHQKKTRSPANSCVSCLEASELPGHHTSYTAEHDPFLWRLKSSSVGNKFGSTWLSRFSVAWRQERNEDRSRRSKNSRYSWESSWLSLEMRLPMRWCPHHPIVDAPPPPQICNRKYRPPASNLQ